MSTPSLNENLRLYRQTVRLSRFSIKNRYRNTFAGLFWVFSQPLIQFGIQAYAFKYIVRIEQENYIWFLMSGLLPWIFFVTSVEVCTTAFTSHSYLFKSIVMSPVTFVLSQLLDNLLVLYVGLSAGSLLLALSGNIAFSTLPLLWLAILPLFFFTIGLATIAATFQVLVRDLRFVLTFGLQALYFATPILYPAEFVPIEHRWLFSLNPLSHLVKPFRAAASGDLELYAVSLATAVALGFASCCLAIVVWKRFSNEVVLRG